MKMVKDALGNRMKENYENRSRHYLIRRTPVIIRLDGKTFHTYTKPLKDRFDKNLIKVMDLTAIQLCEQIQGVQLAYIQSDEISLLLQDYSELTTEAWFDYNKSKIESVSAAIASVTFSLNSDYIWSFSEGIAIRKPAYFDSRSFNLPKEEVCNYFIWRQKDAIRNSVSMLAQTLYSHSELQNKNMSELQEMCFQKGHNWNDLPISHKRGRCIVKREVHKVIDGFDQFRNYWAIDDNIPEFTQDRNYIENLL